MGNTRESPLHVLADNAPSDNDSAMALVYMQKGARPDAQDIDGNTPISLAISHQNFKLVETFIVEFDAEIAGRAKKPIDWKAIAEKERQQRSAIDAVEAKEEKIEFAESNALNLNTSV